MRRQLHIYFLTAIASLTLASCLEDNGGTVQPETLKTPLFSASIEGSRAYDRTWEKGDRIGICGKTGDRDYHNVPYHTPGADGRFEILNKGEEIYFQDPEEVTFTAYYPHNAASHATRADESAFRADTRRQGEQREFDFLFAMAKGSKQKPQVDFLFQHRMTKITFTVKCGTDVSYEEVKSAILSLDYVAGEGTFDTHTGEAKASATLNSWSFSNTDKPEANVKAVIDEYNNTVSYSLILFPQVFEYPVSVGATFPGTLTFKAAIDFTEANRNAGDKDPKHEWVANRQYNIGLVLHKTGFSVEGVSISGWQVGGIGEGSAK